MRAHEIIIESQGGLIRRSQEVSQGKSVSFSKGEDKLNLQSAIVVPETETKYETTEELTAAVEDVLKNNQNPEVRWTNQPGRKGGAALITLWKDPQEKSVAFIKYSNNKKPGAFPIIWTNSDFTSSTGYVQSDSKVAERAQFDLKPNSILPSGVDLQVSQITKVLNLSGNTNLPEEAKSQIPELIQHVLIGNATPVKGAAKYATTYEVDLGESVAPIALSTGNFVTGSYKEAEDSLLVPLGLTWKSLKTVMFPSGGSNLLYDSFMPLGKETTLKISSKDKKGGAAAAVTGLMKDIQLNPDRFKNITDNKSFQEILKIVEIVADSTAMQGPLVIAERYGMITNEDSQNIKENFGKGIKYNPQLPWANTPGVKAAFNRKGAKFQDLAYDMGFHALAGVAELVADKLNAMPEVSDFFKAVLERSTMVQVKTNMATSGEDAFFKSFQVIYPPVFKGVIKVVAGNNYMSTRKPIGKISFKIP